MAPGDFRSSLLFHGTMDKFIRFITNSLKKIGEHLPGGVVAKNALLLLLFFVVCALIFYILPGLIALAVILLMMIPLTIHIVFSNLNPDTENYLAIARMATSGQTQIPPNQPLAPPPPALAPPRQEPPVLDAPRPPAIERPVND